MKSGGRGIVERVVSAEVEVGLLGGVDADGAVGAHEIDIVGLGVGSGIADGDAVEHGVDDVVSVVVHVAVGLGPLHDIRLAGLYAGQVVAEVHRQRAVAEAGRCEGLHRGTLQGRAGEVVHAEGQAQRVPRAVLVERASGQRHVSHVAVFVTDSRAVVAVVGQTDGGGRHVVGAIV